MNVELIDRLIAAGWSIYDKLIVPPSSWPELTWAAYYTYVRHPVLGAVGVPHWAEESLARHAREAAERKCLAVTAARARQVRKPKVFRDGLTPDHGCDLTTEEGRRMDRTLRKAFDANVLVPGQSAGAPSEEEAYGSDRLAQTINDGRGGQQGAVYVKPEDVPLPTAWEAYKSDRVPTTGAGGYDMRHDARTTIATEYPTKTKEHMKQRDMLAFHKHITDSARNLMEKKSHDYAGTDDALSNFRMCASIGLCSASKGILIRLTDKLSRLARVGEDGCKVNESETDTVVDIINYAVLYLACRESENGN